MADSEVGNDTKTLDSPKINEGQVARLSAKASRLNGPVLTPQEIEAAEEEAQIWVRRVNSC